MDHYRDIIARNQVPLSAWDKKSLWFLPVFFGGMGIYFLITNDPRIWLYHPMDMRYVGFIIFFLMIVVGVFFGYRAMISRKLTFVSDIRDDAVKRKIISELKDSFHWVIRKEDKNYFFFHEAGLWGIGNESYITLIYDENGFYINCIVQTFRAGNYTSFIRTRNYVKKLRQLMSDCAV